VRTWNYETGEPLGPPLLHPEAVQDAAFIAEGRLIAAATKGGDVRIWDPLSGEAVSPYLRDVYADFADYTLGSDHLYAWPQHTVDRDWELRASTFSQDELQTLAGMLNWGSEGASGDETEWDATGFHAAWRRLKELHPEEFSPSESAVLNWHQREAIRHVHSYPGFRRDIDDRSRFQSAVWHLDRLIPLLKPPVSRGWLLLRAGVNESLGRHDAAIADYTAVLEQNPRDELALAQRAAQFVQKRDFKAASDDLRQALTILIADQHHSGNPHAASMGARAETVYTSPSIHVEAAVACLIANDIAGYTAVCEQLLDVVLEADWREFRADVVFVCGLHPAGMVDEERIRQLAEGAAENTVDPDSKRSFGAVLYRLGEWELAGASLEIAIEERPEFPTAWVLLAMTEHQLAHADRARELLQKAEAWLADEAGRAATPWVELESATLLLNEAGSLP
jgi:tetratricopeptide (TPR) repeat protein